MEERLFVSDAHDAEDIETTGIITKLIVFRASGAVIIMSSALIVTLLSADAVHFELSHISMISLVELFLDRKEQMTGLMFQNVVMVAIGMIKSKLQVLNKEIMSKERLLSTSKKKKMQIVLDLISPAKRLATGEIKIVESKMLDATIASFFYENALLFYVADSPSLVVVINVCIEFGQHHPGRRYKAPNRRRISGPLLESAPRYEATTVSGVSTADY